jgi:hypothetical protein
MSPNGAARPTPVAVPPVDRASASRELDVADGFETLVGGLIAEGEQRLREHQAHHAQSAKAIATIETALKPIREALAFYRKRKARAGQIGAGRVAPPAAPPPAAGAPVTPVTPVTPGRQRFSKTALRLAILELVRRQQEHDGIPTTALDLKLAPEIAAHTEGHSNGLYNALSDLVARGELVRVLTGVYRLPPTQEATSQEAQRNEAAGAAMAAAG